MMFVKNSLKNLICLAGLISISAAQAQKMSDLLVTKDAKPGQWMSTPTQIPKGLESVMKSESVCATKEQMLQELNKSLQMISSGATGENSCPTTVVSNTSTEAVMKFKCASVKAEATYSIKRSANDTWAFTWSGLNGSGAMSTMQTTMKYLGACR